MKQETKKEICYFVVTALITIAALVVILGINYDFFSNELFWDSIFSSVETTTNGSEINQQEIVKTDRQSFFSIAMAFLGVVGLWVAASFYKEQARQQGRQADALKDQTDEMQEQTKIARAGHERSEIEKIEKDYRQAVKDLVSEDRNSILMSCTTIKQITAKHPKEFLEISYEILIKTLHNSFNQICKVEVNGVEKLEYMEHSTTRISKDMFAHIQRFQKCFETIGQIRNFKKVLDFENKNNLESMLILEGINLGLVNEDILGIIGGFEIKEASFEYFIFKNCDFRSVRFTSTNFCFAVFGGTKEFKKNHSQTVGQGPKINFKNCILTADQFYGEAHGKNWFIENPIHCIKCDVFINNDQELGEMKKIIDDESIFFHYDNYQSWRSVRKKPNSRVENKNWIYEAVIK